MEKLISSANFCGWRFASKDFLSWAKKMSDLHEQTWRKAGIFEAIMASTKKIHKDRALILSVAERWCPQTNSFKFPWGEATITLEDVMVLLGFSVLGDPYFASLDSSGEETKAKLDSVCAQIKEEKGFNANQVAWIARFMDSGDELEHVAFLVSWLSYFVFPPRYYHLTEDIMSIAAHLSRGKKIALAPAVLAHLYAELSCLRTHIRDFKESTIPLKIDLSALFKLVQVWTWERFRELQPANPNPMLKGEPRLALWHDLKQRASNARQILKNSRIDDFEWRPYTRPVKNWRFPQFYPDKAMWVPIVPNLDDELISFARCIKVSALAGINCVEQYLPNRVASQFGMLQDVPSLVNQNNLSQMAAWKDYDKPIDDLTLYIPSRSTAPQVTPRIEFPELQQGFVESRNKRLKYRKREDDERTMGRCQTQLPSDKDDEEVDILTIAQRVKRRFRRRYSDVEKSGGDVSEPLGKRSRREADNNDSGPCQKLISIRADGDEGVPPPEIEQRNEETDEMGSKAGKHMVLSPYDGTNYPDPPVGFDGGVDVVVSPPETRQPCDDELYVYGSNVEKMTMIDDGSKEPECFLHEDGAIAGEKESSESLTQKKDDDNSLIKKNLATDEPASKADNNELSPRQKLASGDGTQGQDCLFLDDGLRSEGTMKSKVQLEDLEKRNDGFGEGDTENASIEKSIHEVNVQALSIEERIAKLERKLALSKKRRA